MHMQAEIINDVYTMSFQSKPTRDEMKVIAQLNQAVAQALECVCFFDVFDELDVEEGINFQPSVCKSTFVENPCLSKLARQFGNACNSFLRSAACSYQAVILHQDCTTGEPIETGDFLVTLPITRPKLVPTDCDTGPVRIG